VILCFMDVFASTRMFRLVGLADLDAFSIFVKEKKQRRSSGHSALAAPTLDITSSLNQNVEHAIKNGYIYNYDVLEFIILKASRTNKVPEQMRQLSSYCNDLIEQLVILAHDQQSYIRTVLETYLPSNDGNGDAEKLLLYLLLSFTDGPIPPTNLDTG